jgi:hypothetical protein
MSMEADMLRDQLTESINAALLLRNSGKTVLAEAEYAAEATNNGLNFSSKSDPCMKKTATAEPSDGETVEES